MQSPINKSVRGNRSANEAGEKNTHLMLTTAGSQTAEVAIHGQLAKCRWDQFLLSSHK
jgi:hypothetical protein